MLPVTLRAAALTDRDAIRALVHRERLNHLLAAEKRRVMMITHRRFAAYYGRWGSGASNPPRRRTACAGTTGWEA